MFFQLTPLLSLLLLLAVTLVSASRDYYDLLGVPRDAAAPTIKRAYRRLAKMYHPDRNPGDAKAERKFKKMTEAYEILTDDNKRAIYDQYGEEGLKQNAQGGAHDFGGGGFMGDFFGGGGGGRTFHMEFGDMGGFFGGDVFADAFGGRRANAYARAESGRGAGGRRRVCTQSKVCENGGCTIRQQCSMQ